jgi:hypothetical protein
LFQDSSKYSFLRGKVYDDGKQFLLFVSTSVVSSSGGFPYTKTQNTISYIDEDKEKFCAKTNTVTLDKHPVQQ